MKLSPRASRVIAVGLLLLAVTSGYLFVFEPLKAVYDSQQARIDLLAARVQRMEASDAGAPELQSQIDAMQSQGDAAAPFWPGATDAVAAAGLQERVKDLLANEGAVIDSTEALPAAADGALRRIALKVRFIAAIDQFQRVVHAIEVMSPSLVIDRLTVHMLDEEGADGPSLAVEMHVFGLAHPGPAEPAT